MSARSAKESCDKYARQLVHARGYCERCGRTDGPWEAAHIVRRRHVGDPDGTSLRTNPENMWCLDKACHRTVDNDALAFGELVVKTIGVARYAELQALKNAPHRPWREKDWQRERDRLKALRKEAA